MILYSILLKEAYEILQSEGSLFYRDHWVDDPDDKDFWRTPFRWLSGEMRKQIGPPPEGVTYPLWAWYQWDGAKKRRPDLRHNCFVRKGEVAYRVEFEIDDKDVVLSNFDSWHCVLNDSYLPISEADDEAFDSYLKERDAYRYARGKGCPEDIRQQIEESWQRVFDLSLVDDDYMHYPLDKKAIQATFWTLSLDQVRKVDRFVGR